MAIEQLDDERTIPALRGCMASGGVIAAGILKYGLKALPAVRAQLTNQNPSIRFNAVGAAVTILEEDHGAKSHAQALGIIRTALADPHFLVRGMALDMIEKLSDRAQFAPVLEYMAEHDTDVAEQPGGERKYPLRGLSAYRVGPALHTRGGSRLGSYLRRSRSNKRRGRTQGSFMPACNIAPRIRRSATAPRKM